MAALARGTLLALACILFVLWPADSSRAAAPKEVWTHRYDGPIPPDSVADTSRCVVVDSDGDVIVAGGNGDFLLIKYSAADGRILWQTPGVNRVQSRGLAIGMVLLPGDDIVVTGPIRGEAQSDISTARYSGKTGELVWERRYNGPAQSGDGPESMALAQDGSLLVVGVSLGADLNVDFCVLKYSSSDGRLLWASRSAGVYALGQVGQTIAVDHNGDAFVCGRANTLPGSPVFLWLTKLDGATGQPLWERRFEGHEGAALAGTLEPSARALAGYIPEGEGAMLVLDPQGNVILTHGPNLAGGSPIQTIKCRGTDGSTAWTRSGDARGNPVAIACDPSDGSIVLTGGSPGGRLGDFYTVKYANEDGALLWERRYYGTLLGIYRREIPTDVAIDRNGDVVVTGGSAREYRQLDFYTGKYSGRDGAVIWERRLPNWGGEGAIPAALAITGEGNAVVTGGGCIPGVARCGDVYTAMYSGKDGGIVWTNLFDSPANANDTPTWVAVDRAGDVLVTGFLQVDNPDHIVNGVEYLAKYSASDGRLIWSATNHFNGFGATDPALRLLFDAEANVFLMDTAPGANFRIKKYSRDSGEVMWEAVFDDTPFDGDHPRAMALGPDGSLVVTGTCGYADVWTVSLSGLTGRQLWAQRRSGPARYQDHGRDVALDPAGHAVVVGYSLDTHSVAQLYAAKYAAEDGRVLWERWDADGVPDGTAGRRGLLGRAVAVDAQGDVYVTGELWNLHDFDVLTLKYDGRTGEVLWRATFAGPAQGDDLPKAILVEPTGDVVVSGQSWNGRNWDWVTVRYDAARGTVRWERALNGVDDLDDTFASMVIDPKGCLLLCGTSASTAGGPDYLLAEYALESGSVLWQTRRDGPAHLEDHAVAMAVGVAGEIAVTGYSRYGTRLGYDMATVLYREGGGARLTATRIVETGVESVRLRFEGLGSTTWEVQRSFDLKSWQPAGTVTGGLDGTAEWTDAAVGTAKAFYRAVRG